MSDYTAQILAQLDPQLRKLIPSGVEIYDALMEKIEPELTSEQVKTLKVKYANQTEAERQARMQRYQIAFKRYQEAFINWAAQMHLAIDEYKDLVVSKAAKESKASESSQLESLEEAITDLPTDD